MGSGVGTFSYKSVDGENVGDDEWRQHPAEREGKGGSGGVAHTAVHICSSNLCPPY